MTTKLKYKEQKAENTVSIARGAEIVGVSYARFRKALQRLQIPIVRHGWAVVVPANAIPRVKKSFEDGTIRRGRKKKAG
jgi:hypothetical protein